MRSVELTMWESVSNMVIDYLIAATRPALQCEQYLHIFKLKRAQGAKIEV